MKVSVVIVNYNGISFIAECVGSVLASVYQHIEVVIVDNASTDGSLAYLTKKYGKNPKVKIVRTDKQLFFTGGSNLGAIHASGDKLIFLNNDTVVDKNFITELVKLAAVKDKCLIQPKILAYHHRQIIDTVGGRYNYFGYGFAVGRGETDNGQYNTHTLIDYANGTCFWIDKQLFFQAGGFDEWYRYYYEDIDLNLRAKVLGASAWYCHKSVIYHRGSVTFKKYVPNADLLFNIRKNRLRTVIKNFDGFQRLAKVMCLLLVYCSQIVKNLITHKPAIASATLDSITAVISLEHKVFVNKIRLWELRNTISKNRFSLLDLGCGDGTFIDIAIKKGVDALGVEAIPRVHNKIINSKIENFRPELAVGKFDVISLYHVIEHLHKPIKTLNKISSWLKPDGWLVIETPLVGNLTNKFLGNNYFVYSDKGHQNLFTEKELVTVLGQSGWEIKKTGFTLLEFPFTVITTAFRKNVLYGLVGIALFLPLKLLSLAGLNTEITRVYCQKVLTYDH